MEIFEEVKSFLGDEENKDTSLITPFLLLTKNAVESLRYRAEVNDLILSFTTRKPFIIYSIQWLLIVFH